MAKREKGSAYIVAGAKSWNHRVYDEMIRSYPGRWCFVARPQELALRLAKKPEPRYIFFLHWSWKVPDEIVKRYECVCFHMTDVPYGRGGSPLQNLITRGHKSTKLTALRMVSKLDAGPVYLKEDLYVGDGTAEEIYINATYKASEMIRRIISGEIKPVPQKGKATTFKRRLPEESEIPDLQTLPQLYDFIRMLDAEGYPRAFIKWRGFRLEFSGSVLNNGQVTANVRITKANEGEI